jgi:hypothetical protein
VKRKPQRLRQRRGHEKGLDGLDFHASGWQEAAE